MLCISRKKKIILAAIIIFIIGIIFADQVYAFSISNTGLQETSNKAYGGAAPIQGSLSTVIGKVVGAALSFIGILFLLLMIYGGVIWMIARGNESEVAKAKDIIIAAVTGLVIVLAAYGITAYVGNVLMNTQ